MLLSLLTCREALKHLDDYLDRELSERDLVLVEKHLRICRHCARQFSDEAAFIRNLRSKMNRIEAPTGLLAKIAAGLETGAVTPDQEVG